MSGNSILVMGDFNEDVYNGVLSKIITDEPLQLCELCQWTTGQHLPPTHHRGSYPIDAIFCTADIAPTAVSLLPFGAGVGDHRVFLLDLTSSQSLIGDAFPRLMPAASRLSNCNSKQIRNKYNQVLNQLSNQHLLFHKLLWLNDEVDSLTETQFLLRINKID